MNQPLTPEMLEGTVEERAKAYYCEKSDHLGICATNWEDIDEVARGHFRNVVRNSPDFLRQKVESLLAQIESQARRVEEVTKERDEWRETAESIYASQPKALKLVHELRDLRSQLSTAKEAIRVKDEALNLWQAIRNHEFHCHTCQGGTQCEWGMENGRKLHEIKTIALSAPEGGGAKQAEGEKV